MDAALLLRKRRMARSAWHELDDPPRRALLVRRPTSLAQLPWLQPKTVETILPLLVTAVVDWRGFTEADLLGPAVGGSDEVAFEPQLFQDWAEDEPETVGALVDRVVDLITKDSEAREAAAKN